MTEHEKLLDALVESAKEEFAEYGSVTPSVGVHSARIDVWAHPAGPGEGGRMATWMPMVVLGLVSSTAAYAAGFVAEAWMRAFTDREAADEIRRGDLQRAADHGDAEVRTCLLAGAVSHFGSVFRVDVEHRADDGSLTWEPYKEEPMDMGGALYDGLLEAWKSALDGPRLPDSVDVTEAVAFVLAATNSEGVAGIEQDT